MKRFTLLIGVLALCISCKVQPVSPDGNLSMQIGEDGGITVLYKGHRGAKPPRRCELLGEISLLSPG